jgi:hypothetical protein
MVLLDLGVPVVDVQTRGDPRGDHPGAEPSRGGLLALADDPPVEDQTDLVGAADVEAVPEDLVEEHPPGDGTV